MEITPEIARELLHYDPVNGIFTWRHRERWWFKTNGSFKAWNRQFAGKRAGCIWRKQRHGYKNREIRINGSRRPEHHLAWVWMTDKPLPVELDHINRDATDNRWVNLRASCRDSNTKNRSMLRTNTSGVTGVTWCPKSNKWQARCQLSGKRHRLGAFSEIDEAAMVVLEFRASHGFDPRHGLEVAPYHEGLTRPNR